MKRKLIWLNIALAGLIVAAGYRINEEWTAQRNAGRPDSPIAYPPGGQKAVAPFSPPPAPVTAGGLQRYRNKMLFSPERNPTVVVEIASEAAAQANAAAPACSMA